VPDELVRLAALLVDRSGVVGQVESWQAAGRRGPGGRPETFPLRALVVAMVLCAQLHEPLLATSFTEVLFRRMSPGMRSELGVPEPPAVMNAMQLKAHYRNVRTRLHGLLGVMDPSPLPKNRRLSRDDFVAATERQRGRLDEEGWAERGERLTWFINALLEATLTMVPRELRRRWKGSVAVDATVVPAFARAERRVQGGATAASRPVVKHSADPDAAWYFRDEGAEADNVWGYEASLAASGPESAGETDRCPSLVVGMAPLHRPGHDPGKNAVVALRSVRQRGHPAHWLAGDRAYSNQKPEHFQLPARALGYRPVFDYKVDQLGIQDEYRGMLQIEGTWYCPAIPKSLVDATADFRAGKIDEPTWRARLEERRHYAIVAKSGPDAEWHRRVRCPASSPHPTVRCELKPASVPVAVRGRLRVRVPGDLATHPPAICTQQSVILPPEAGAKLAQDLAYGSPEYHERYATLRNSIEGFNGFVKDGAHEALDDPERRRIRGVAAQSVFVALLIMAANMRKIRTAVEQLAEEGGRLRRLSRRRRTAALGAWLPSRSAPAEGPEPPLLA
jgi:hypothetical protein